VTGLQKAGGLGAFYQAAAYVAAIVLFLVVLDYGNVSSAAEKTALLIEHGTAMYLMHLIVYQLFGIVLVVLTLALRERLQAGAPALMSVATVLGLIWSGLLIASGMVFNVGALAATDLYGRDPAAAVTLWSAVDTVSSGLSGNGELLGGTWMILLSVAGWRGKTLSRGLAVLGFVVGGIGVLSVIPVLVDLEGLFGLTQIVWFVWIGISLRRNS